jgi:hypothetical protein
MDTTATSRARLSGTCWSEPALPVALSRDVRTYVSLAQDLLDAVPDDWSHVVASLTLDPRLGETCTTRCGPCGGSPPDEECGKAVRDALRRLLDQALVPRTVAWIAVLVDFSVDRDRLVATIAHGGPTGRPQNLASVRAPAA